MNAKALWTAMGMTIALALPLTAVAQQDPCAGFTWNVEHERALFASPATTRVAGTNTANAPTIEPDRLEELQLHPREQVSFALPPGSVHADAGTYAGLVRLHVIEVGAYRVALDQAAWIDVVAQGQIVASGDHQAQAGCHAPHKIVQFTLLADQELLLQLSASGGAQLRLTVTRANGAAH
jgi:hypothetical protein